MYKNRNFNHLHLEASHQISIFTYPQAGYFHLKIVIFINQKIVHENNGPSTSSLATTQKNNKNARNKTNVQFAINDFPNSVLYRPNFVKIR